MNTAEINNSQETFNNNNIQTIITTPSKRMRESLQNSILGNATKTPRLTHTESPLKFIAIMNKQFDKLTEQLTEQIQTIIETKFQEHKNNLLCELDKRFNERFNEIKNDLNEVTNRVNQLESVAVEITIMKEEIKNLKTQLKRQENKTVARELRIIGIPLYTNENLLDIFGNICSTIGISLPAIKTIYRLRNQNNKHKTNITDAPIIVKMWSPYDKNFFLKSLSNFKKANKDFFFTLNHIGFEADTKFFVNESLTVENYQILRAAMRMKKEKHIHSAFSMRGLVYVKLSADGQLIRIDDYKQLNTIAPGSERFFADRPNDQNT